jgi:hypothetical protein
MAKRKRSGRPPQLQHGKKSTPSQHDKRNRLSSANPTRRKTDAASVPLVGGILIAVTAMQSLLHARIGFRLPIIVAGALLARGRRTASSWFRAAGVKDDWDRFYELLVSAGKVTTSLALPLLRVIVKRFDPGPDGYLTLAVDDSPTKRFGRHVEGANIHHHPTPGPVDSEWLYGHNWVCLAVLVTHPMWGVIALPLLSMLYVRQCDVAALHAKNGWEFQTKHELALRMIKQVASWLRVLGSQAKLLVVFDGAYAAHELVSSLVELKMTVISRLRSNAKLFDLPPVRKPSTRGRPRKYGSNRIDLSKRSKHKNGWKSISYVCRGVAVLRHYKTFLATTSIADGPIRVVIVRFDNGETAAYFSTDPNMAVEMILETVAGRWAIEEFFHDTKETWGAGKQQVRNVWSNIACWNLNAWLYALVELECWDTDMNQVVDRSDRPWDNPDRRPSHADRRRKIALQMLRNRFIAELPTAHQPDKIVGLFDELLCLAA